MICREWRSELPDYVRGRADEASKRRLADHLTTCRRCEGEMRELEAAFAAIEKSKSWSPPATYWASILPRLHRRLEKDSTAWLPQWTTRFALPVAAAIVLAITIIKIAPRSSEEFPDNFSVVLAQLPPEELQDVRDQQTVPEILQPYIAAHEQTASDDVDEVKTILQEDGTGGEYMDLEAGTIPEEVSDQDAEALLPVLQGQDSTK